MLFKTTYFEIVDCTVQHRKNLREVEDEHEKKEQ